MFADVRLILLHEIQERSLAGGFTRLPFPFDVATNDPVEPLYIYEFDRGRVLHFCRERDLCFFQNRIGCLGRLTRC